MTQAELSRVERLAQRQAGRLAAADAAMLLGRSRRQVFRRLTRHRSSGPAGLASRRRGRPGHHRLPDAVGETALELVRERYGDVGPTLAAEKLVARHGSRSAARPCAAG